MSYPGFLPAWSVDGPASVAAVTSGPWPADLDRKWAWGGADGSGVRVCILDSGVDATHPRVGPVAGTYGVEVHEDDSASVVPDDGGDSSGHGTACASIIRSLAPGAEITSVKVLTSGITGGGAVLGAALRWVIDERFDVVKIGRASCRERV